jgi:hypothetical protein
MKIALIILALLALAWFGWKHQEQAKQVVQPYLPQSSGEVEYAKCTTADGKVIYGTQPFETPCRKIEVVKRRTTVVPALKQP